MMNMKITPLLTDQKVLAVERIVPSDTLIVLIVNNAYNRPHNVRAATTHRVACIATIPARWQILPWQGVAVQAHTAYPPVLLSIPRMPTRILRATCPVLGAPHGRRTLRLHEVLRLIGFMLGGEAGARLASLARNAYSSGYAPPAGAPIPLPYTTVTPRLGNR